MSRANVEVSAAPFPQERSFEKGQRRHAKEQDALCPRIEYSDLCAIVQLRREKLLMSLRDLVSLMIFVGGKHQYNRDIEFAVIHRPCVMSGPCPNAEVHRPGVIGQVSLAVSDQRFACGVARLLERKEDDVGK